MQRMMIRWRSGPGAINGEPVPRFPNRSLLFASLTPCCADPAPAIHYAPIENLEHIDVALIDGAEHEIDMADWVKERKYLK